MSGPEHSPGLAWLTCSKRPGGRTHLWIVMPLLGELAQTWEKIPERGPFTHVRQALLIPTFLGYILVPFPNPGTQTFVLFPGLERELG